MLIDSHCHLDHIPLEGFEQGLDDLAAAWRAAGVQQVLCVGLTPTQSERVIEIAERYDDVKASVGLHPTEEPEHLGDLDKLWELAAHPKVVAIGEAGLDYYRPPAHPFQQERFRRQIQLAKAVGKPLIVHTRSAKADTLRILDEEQFHHGVLHCFTEDAEMATAALERGWMISFSGIITFKNAVALREVVKAVPLSKMLIETDAPYLTPVPYRGKVNHPARVIHVAEAVAALHAVSVEEVVKMTGENFQKLLH